MKVDYQGEFSPTERRIAQACLEKEKAKTAIVKRESDEEFDISIEGTVKEGFGFSGWLVLSAIHNLVDWTQHDVAWMTDYPDMAMSGDWSGVRDTDKERLWEIFEEHVLPKFS